MKNYYPSPAWDCPLLRSYPRIVVWTIRYINDAWEGQDGRHYWCTTTEWRAGAEADRKKSRDICCAGEEPAGNGIYVHVHTGYGHQHCVQSGGDNGGCNVDGIWTNIQLGRNKHTHETQEDIAIETAINNINGTATDSNQWLTNEEKIKLPGLRPLTRARYRKDRHTQRKLSGQSDMRV